MKEKLENEMKRFGLKTITVIFAALTIVVTVAWSEFLKQLFVKVFGPENTLSAALGYAIFVTLLVVFFPKIAKKLGYDLEQKDKEENKNGEGNKEEAPTRPGPVQRVEPGLREGDAQKLPDPPC